MLKADLANELRQRQYKKKLIPRKMIDSVTDDEIIDSYITCSCCGEKQVEDLNQLEQIIVDSGNSDDFLQRCESVARANALIHCAEDIVKEKGF
jgi:hypothetical protein